MQKTKFFMTLLCLIFVCTGLCAQDFASDQKAGSLLVFPLITTDGNQRDTRITISNFGVGAGSNIWVHLIFIDKITCQQSDEPIMITASGSWSAKASEIFPYDTGYLVAYAMDDRGCPIQKNVLVGNAFVQAPDGYFGPRSGAVADVYNAESFWAYRTPFCDPAAQAASLRFDGADYDLMPSRFAVEFQKTSSVPGQTIVLASMDGFATTTNISPITQSSIGIASGCRANGTVILPGSFTNLFTGTCQVIKTLTQNVPNILGATGIDAYAVAGSGLMTFSLTEGAVGLIITPKNSLGWSGIRQLHHTATKSALFVVPVYAPS
jgi:hypothetical protein